MLTKNDFNTYFMQAHNNCVATIEDVIGTDKKYMMVGSKLLVDDEDNYIAEVVIKGFGDTKEDAEQDFENKLSLYNFYFLEK